MLKICHKPILDESSTYSASGEISESVGHAKLSGSNPIGLKTSCCSFYFSKESPNKPGLYEFTSFIVPDPTKNTNENNFFMAEAAYRFTIEVEE
ncbi:hypothetical protein ACFY5J_19145 [Peribacillus butanolivorans]|uniref:hypothetical protein n=1 Tax=Peribacillus butanolivorans TaxID=421767 RepID=UPI003678D766